MEICVDNANRSIFNAANSNPQYSGMGTTLVVGVFQDGRLMLGHIGDSRCYRLRGGELEQITKDHSLLQEQMDAGLITPEQAAVSTNKNLVTRALGVEDAVLLEVNEHRVEPGDIYLMCSDGLSDMVDDEGIARILAGRRLPWRTRSGSWSTRPMAMEGATTSRCCWRRPTRMRKNGASSPDCWENEAAMLFGLENELNQQESAMPKMIVSIDGVVIKEVQLTKDRTTLGRRPYNDIVIDNLAVSGEHAVLQMIGQRGLPRRPEQHQRHLRQRQGRQEAVVAEQRHGRDRQVQDQVHQRGAGRRTSRRPWS